MITNWMTTTQPITIEQEVESLLRDCATFVEENPTWVSPQAFGSGLISEVGRNLGYSPIVITAALAVYCNTTHRGYTPQSENIRQAFLSGAEKTRLNVANGVPNRPITWALKNTVWS